MDILGRGRADEPLLGLDRPTREALAVYCRRRWSANLRKAIEREWDLSPDEARGVMEATASGTTVDKIWKHPRGGWAVALPVLGAVIGHGVGSFFAAEAARAKDEAERRQQEAQELAAIERAAHAAVVRLVTGSPDDQRPDLASGLSDLGGLQPHHNSRQRGS